MVDIDLPGDIKYDVMKATFEWIQLDPEKNHYMNKEQTQDVYYRVCDFGHLGPVTPNAIDEEFDLIAGESGKINRLQFLKLVKNIYDKYLQR